jgi:maltooligosyltrehalose trehalohydrolase
VGNRAAGERLSVLVTFEQLKLAAALLLLSPYVPLLWMGEEYGETNPFQYFVSHTDPALAEAVRQGRRKEFESFGWGEDVPDPMAAETFERSTLDRSAMHRGEHGALLRLYRDLLRLRRAEPALRPGDAAVEVAHGDRAWVTVRLAPAAGGGATLVAVFNVSDAPRVVPLPAAPRFRRWSPVLATDAPAFSRDVADAADVNRSASVLGTVRVESAQHDGAAQQLTVPAWTAYLFRDSEDH